MAAVSRFNKLPSFGCWSLASGTLLLGVFLLAPHAFGATNAPVKRVLILHSFGRDFAPFNAVSSVFRTELARQSTAPIEFFEASLETARFTEAGSEIPFVDYLRVLFADRPPALTVTFGEPAMNFLRRHRERLFHDVPMLLAAVDQRHLSGVTFGAKATAVAVRFDLPGIVENILRILPSTANIAVVIGNSPLEKFWLTELRRELRPFTNRVQFTWLNELSFESMCKRLAGLPPNSAIFYALLLVDAAGVPHEQNRALEILHSEANAPIFGLFDSQLGGGIVGGPLYLTQEVSRESVRLALRILGGESPSSMQPLSLGPGMPVYDWRELKRWGISENRLPPGHVVQFRPPSVWQQYKWYIIGAFMIIAVQAAMIADLLLERRRRRRAQAELSESEQRMDLAAGAAGLGLWMWDIVRDALWITDKGRALFGFTKTERVDLNRFLSALHPEDREAVGLAVTKSLNGGGIYESEYRVVLPDGQTRWFAGRGRVEFDRSSKPVRMRGVSLDITERKHAELEAVGQRVELAHMARISTMGELATSVAHELNQPLGAILSNAEAAEMFLDQDPPAIKDVREILEDIRKDDQRAGEVIQRMRVLLRKREMELQPLDINELVQDVLKLIGADAALRKSVISATLAPGLPLIYGDRVHLQQVLLNLILNGMDATAEQPADTRRLAVCTKKNDNGEVEVAVTDTGHGVTPDKLSRVFEPFFTTKRDGMGMGLAISQNIIEMHRGRIWAENNPACGATFRFTLPVGAEESDAGRV